MMLDFAITSGSGLSRDKKAEEMRIMDEKYHRLWKDLHSETHALQQAAVKDKEATILNSSRIADIYRSSNDVDYLRSTYMQSLLVVGARSAEMELTKCDYVKNLGHGGCGVVNKVKWLGLDCALKILGGQDEKEATTLKGLFHPNIIRLLHYWEDLHEDPQSCLLMELMLKDLGRYMEDRMRSMSSFKPQGRKPNMPFSIPVAIDIMYQVAQAMRYMHDQRLAHRDLKPSNILVRESSTCNGNDGYLDIKLGDFGLVKAYTHTSTFQAPSGARGTGWYRAPEMFGKNMAQQINYLQMADVWSFGITCAEILSGKGAYAKDVDKYGFALQAKVCKEGLKPTLPKHCPNYLAFCINSCWEYLPSRRPPFANLCKLLRHAKLLSLGVTHLDDSKYFFAYLTRSGQVRSLDSSAATSSKGRISTFFQSSLKVMGIGPVPTSSTIEDEEEVITTPMVAKERRLMDEVAIATIGKPSEIVNSFPNHQEHVQQSQASMDYSNVRHGGLLSAKKEWLGGNIALPKPCVPPNLEDLRTNTTSSLSSSVECNNSSLEQEGFQLLDPPLGFYQDDDAKPSLRNLLMVVFEVKSTVKQFAKILISNMNKQPVDYEHLKQTMIQEVEISMDTSNHWKYLVQAFICKRLFDGFNASNGYFGIEFFDNDPLPMSKLNSFADYSKFKDMAATISKLPDSNSPDGSFLGRFCFKKFLSIFSKLAIYPHDDLAVNALGKLCFKKVKFINHGEVDVPVFREEWIHVEKGCHPKTKFYQSFLKVAVSVRLVHRLVHSFEDTVDMLFYEKGCKFQRETMESAVPESYEEGDEDLDANTEVGFSVIPGFQTSRSVVKCEVYLRSKNSHT